MKDIQTMTRELVDKYRLSTQLHIRILDLMSEVGELCKEYNKITEYGRNPFAVTKDFELEIGDVFFSLIFIANISGINLEEALEKTILKMEKRMKKTGNIGSGRRK